MKKTLLVLLAVVALTACQKNGYKITGEVSDFADGDTVFLTALDWKTGQQVQLGYALVKDEHYLLRGKVKEPTFATVTCEDPSVNMIYRSEFYLEPGEIDIQLGIFGFQAKGTPLNDKKFAYMAHLDDVATSMDKFRRKLKSETSTEHEKKVAEVQIDVTRTNEAKNTLATIQENSSNLFGLDILLINLSRYDEEEQAELIASLTPELQRHPVIAEILKIAETQRKTAAGEKFVDFEQMDTYGETIFFSIIVAHNRYTLLHFWSSQRADSQTDLEYLREVYNKYNAKGLEVVGVCIERDGDEWVDKVNELDVTWLQLSDLKWADNEAAVAYGLTRLPETILVQKDGTILARGMHGEEILTEVSKCFQPKQ